MTKRIARLRRLMAEEGLPGIIVSNLNSIRYLCGYSGSNGMMLVTAKSAWFFTDFRYKAQMEQQVRGCRGEMRRRDLYADFPSEYVQGLKKLGVEADHISLSRFNAVKRQLPRTRLVPVKDLVLQLRRAKEPAEVKLIRRAQAVTDKVFRRALPFVKPGASERELAAQIEYWFKQEGESAFPAIVASGPNSALPHAEPTDRKLRRGDAVTFDIGCRRDGYCSDMTRTVFLGKASDDLRQVYHIVLEAQRRALSGIRPGAKCASVDSLARDYIKDQGYGQCFGHGLGHGVGLAVHEQPGLTYAGKDKLASGDIVTVEPGIYLPGLGGVRIEDMALVTKDGYENLTRSPKKLTEL